jgi:hypothetical protein
MQAKLTTVLSALLFANGTERKTAVLFGDDFAFPAGRWAWIVYEAL